MTKRNALLFDISKRLQVNIGEIGNLSNFLTCIFFLYIYNYTWEDGDRNLHMVSTTLATKGLNPDLALKTLCDP